MIYSIALALAVVAAAISSVGGIVYLLWNLSWPAVIVALAAALALAIAVLRLIFLKRRRFVSETAPHFGETATEQKPAAWAWGLIPLPALVAVCFLVLSRSQIDAAVNTPWGAVPAIFWVSLALAAVSGAALFLRAGDRTVTLAVLLLVGLGVSIAAVLYRIGYGYDPFVHQAAEQHILQFGAIAPKTPYYAGQYALAIALARLTTLPIHALDVWLLPLLTAIGIAGSIGVASRARRASSGPFAAVLLALLPLAPFIDATPFGLAALYCLLAAILGLGTEKEPRHKAGVWLFAAASLLTHPIAGVPAIVFAALMQFRSWKIRAPIAVLGAGILPLLFAAANHGLSFSWSRIGAIGLPFETPFTRFHALGDPLYALGAAAALTIILGVIANRAYLVAAASAALSGLLVAASIDFSYLPDSEQGGYAARLMVIALLIAAPAAAAAIAKLIAKAAGLPWRSLGIIAAVAFFFTGGVYLAYPRADGYVLSKGWNTSSTDIAAVRSIAADAGDAPYIVLAAQPVSAAALQEFGFFRYFDTNEGQVFAYPVPTGGPLYQYYLKMIYDEPSSEYMKQAMDLAGVKLGYFVVNSYWTRSDHIISRARETSQKWFGIDNADYVFKYLR
jgi:hypothetical protein